MIPHPERSNSSPSSGQELRSPLKLIILFCNHNPEFYQLLLSRCSIFGPRGSGCSLCQSLLQVIHAQLQAVVCLFQGMQCRWCRCRSIGICHDSLLSQDRVSMRFIVLRRASVDQVATNLCMRRNLRKGGHAV